MAVDNNYPAVTFTPAELKFLCIKAGYDTNTASMLTGILCYHESGGESNPGSTWNLWRPWNNGDPETGNPKGGNDWSGAMVNDKAWSWSGPWLMADPVLALRWIRERILSTSGGFGHYRYPSLARTDASIHLEEMQALEPVNPYWKMYDAGLFAPADMRPEAESWTRWMPSAAEFPGGVGGYENMPPNKVTVQLQEALKRMGFFNTHTSTWYGQATKSGVESLQRLLLAAGWKPSAVDGIYGPKTANAWIRAERYRHVTR